MSKINIEFDTLEKTCTVAVDGAALANVSDIYIGPSYRYDYETERDASAMSIAITTAEQDKDNGTKKMTRLCASDKGLAPSDEAFGAVERDLMELLK